MKDNNRPLLWRKPLQALQDGVLNSVGYPATLRRRINSGALQIKNPQQQDTIWLRSIVSWHRWFGSDKNTIRYLRPDHTGDYEFFQCHIPQLDGLITKNVTENYRCDISTIGGLSSSRDANLNIPQLDDFVLQRCSEMITPLSSEQLARNLSRYTARLSQMVFSQFSWAPGRLYWNNEYSVHNFVAARYQAIQLGQPVSLTGQLNSYTVNPQKIRQLTAEWDLYLLPIAEVYGLFRDALLRVKSPFGISNPPCWENVDERYFQVIWLERNHPVPARISRMLAQAGFPSLGQLLLKPEP
ncbi:TPA: hypothetical protein R4029_003448 [Klebsiella variicola subsp. variicola]|uniref:DUF6685 family protein n=1 Tax=Klebsiella TaxID=570 RepID=UPI00255B186E|nr:DUF6685 family protein [Klebsiella quasipneumoniae]HED2969828.1 hypothetical protein [Klebsiella variicola subsp. variicola]MDL4569805.1 hypothetical protein [Klebsiella quasipneumoniae]MDL4590443.1 hypothetical protein [Klebsiella quasipneumoniae]MDL4595453.1 hypothetical protein [Klebsiella quasipneumoniae]MDL4629916.1 hypothetical protein [Klebsiella quasipneumoniae]